MGTDLELGVCRRRLDDLVEFVLLLVELLLRPEQRALVVVDLVEHRLELLLALRQLLARAAHRLQLRVAHACSKHLAVILRS